MAQNHKTAPNDLPKPRNSPRTNRQLYDKTTSNGRKPTKKDRTRNHTLKQPANQGATGTSKKNTRAGYQTTSTSATYTIHPPVVQSRGKLAISSGAPTTCLFYHQTTYDSVPVGRKKLSGSSSGSSGVRTKTSKFSYLMNNGMVCSGVVRTSSRTSRNGNVRKPSRRLDLDMDDDGYYDDYDYLYNPSIWAY